MRVPAVLLFLFLAMSVQAANVFVYDHDDGATLTDPLGAGVVGTQFAVVRALQASGHQVTTSTVLPTNLSPYDAVFVLTAWGTG
ncbi:hypothetical protein JXA88_09850 [Candidatus Fermentibacteria bacterium]|nr:hypothetical protein [Candidatus Fermentibacteria bacterium]